MVVLTNQLLGARGVTGGVHHTPRLNPALSAAKIPVEHGLFGRMRRCLGRGGPEGEMGEPEPDDSVIVDPMVPSLAADALARLLEELIVSAQTRIDGAVLIMGRSADEAEAYREALTVEAEVLLGAKLGDQVTSALVGVTRNMVARARGAEEKLISMRAELAAVQHDLAEARRSADRDQLTGLPNRRALETTLREAVAGAQAADQMFSLAFCDIDNFKQFNDTHGHALGDRVLRLVADCLSDGVGSEAFVSRHGGEEFVMLFEGMSLEDAAERVDAIREALAMREFKSRTSETPIGRITFSAGVAALRAGEKGGALLQRADQALYRAKNEGRNRVEMDRG
jgi:diguanylate cyclase